MASAFLVRDRYRGDGRADSRFVASPAGKTALTGLASAHPPLRHFDATFRFHEKPRITSIRRNNGWMIRHALRSSNLIGNARLAARQCQRCFGNMSATDITEPMTVFSRFP
ncbi:MULTISPECIES: hypothetical protein [Burkholderia cepacia complex]|uniref:hypothetical protein n=1 Tax=Burkholderia cepacia complex TaxID=87882 RepID=UPI002013200F|nr:MULTISPECIES: hypothetical protein [Burkholderia cepacia complex]MDN7580075.1 hypothetical protein [Burkholderia orbicola]